MITVKHKDGVLIVDSRYDSGCHLGFNVTLLQDGEYTGQTLDEILSKEKIKSLEMILASVTKGYLEEENL